MALTVATSPQLLLIRLLLGWPHLHIPFFFWFIDSSVAPFNVPTVPHLITNASLEILFFFFSPSGNLQRLKLNEQRLKLQAPPALVFQMFLSIQVVIGSVSVSFQVLFRFFSGWSWYHWSIYYWSLFWKWSWQLSPIINRPGLLELNSRTGNQSSEKKRSRDTGSSQESKNRLQVVSIFVHFVPFVTVSFWRLFYSFFLLLLLLLLLFSLSSLFASLLASLYLGQRSINGQNAVHFWPASAAGSPLHCHFASIERVKFWPRFQ